MKKRKLRIQEKKPSIFLLEHVIWHHCKLNNPNGQDERCRSVILKKISEGYLVASCILGRKGIVLGAPYIIEGELEDNFTQSTP